MVEKQILCVSQKVTKFERDILLQLFVTLEPLYSTEIKISAVISSGQEAVSKVNRLKIYNDIYVLHHLISGQNID